MVRFAALFALIGLLAVSSGCVAAAHGDVKGVFYTATKSTMGVVDNDVQPTKTGEASATGMLCWATGDSSVGAAMGAGGITKIHRVDAEVKNILGIYVVHKTIVHGE